MSKEDSPAHAWPDTTDRYPKGDATLRQHGFRIHARWTRTNMGTVW